MTSGQTLDVPPLATVETPRRPATAVVVCVVLWCLLLLGLCLWLYTRNNAFPASFHPDEPGKVTQIANNTRNFNHPQLMLEATQAWMRIAGIPNDRESIVMAGRQVSAFFGAMTAVLLALTVFLCTGWTGFLVASLLLALSPPLLMYSHYMKEDTSLLVGIALTVLASRLTWVTRRWYARLAAWGMMAAGCALAASGKNVGFATLALPLTIAFVAPGFKWYRPALRLAVFIPLFVALLALINYRVLNPEGIHPLAVLQSPGEWRELFDPAYLKSLNAEVNHSLIGHAGLTANRPNSFAIRTALTDSWPAAGIAALLLPLVLIITRKQGWGWELLMILYMALFALLLSCNKILVPRYSMPVVIMLFLLAALAISRLLSALRERPATRFTLTCIASLLIALAQAPACASYTEQFADDSRYALNRWAIENLPKNAVVLADRYASLHDRALPFSRERRDVKIRLNLALPMMKDLPSQLSAAPEYYVVICDMAYSRFFEPSAKPGPGQEQVVATGRRFYGTLLSTHNPIWSSSPERNMRAHTNPAIFVYRLTPEMGKGLVE